MKPRIFHISRRETVQKLRDDILRLHGYDVESTRSFRRAREVAPKGAYDLVLIDVDAPESVTKAEELCDEIKKAAPRQPVAYVCNYRVSINSDCPDEIIRSEFNPEAFVRSIQLAMKSPGASGD